MSEHWRKHGLTTTIRAHRKGWLGAWDAIKSAVTGTPRLEVPVDVHFTFWAKGGDVSVSLAQVEEGAAAQPYEQEA